MPLVSPASRRKPLTRTLRAGVSALAVLAALSTVPAMANPAGGVVVGGSAVIAGGGSTVTINQSSQRAAINWQSFSVGSGETTKFVQPNSSAVTFNRVVGSDPSQILGHVSANGQIILANPNGVVFGKGAVVDAAGLVATTHDADPNAFMQGGSLRFNQKPGANPNASVVNAGTINIHGAGVAAFVAPSVRNSGTINATAGTVDLAAGKGFAIDLYGDKLVSFAPGDAIADTVTDSSGVPVKALVDQQGAINAHSVNLTATTARDVVNAAVRVTGTIAATTVSKVGGTIHLGGGSGTVQVENASLSATNTQGSGGAIHILGDSVNLTNSSIDASGSTGGGAIRIGGGRQGGEGLQASQSTSIDANTTLKANATTTGDGGDIVVWSTDATTFHGTIEAKGGNASGKGGNAEVSSHHVLDFAGTVDLTAAHGTTGTLLLDPEDITIQTASGTPNVTCTSGVCQSNGDGSILTVANLQAALASSNVTISTNAFAGSGAGNVTFANSVTWNTANTLLVNAYGNITINSGVTLSNTYSGNLTAANLPVLLALRSDAYSVGNGSIINNGTINFSGSTGSVATYRDTFNNGGSYTAGVQTANASWVAPTNQSVSSQFTNYQLVNSVNDIAAININATTLGYTYALGKNIVGFGMFNSGAPLGTFTGILDGQLGTLNGGSNYSITNVTLPAPTSTVNVGLFTTNAGIIRNLSLGLDVTQNYTGTTNNYVGTIAAVNTGTLANVISTGSVNYTYSVATSITTAIGGLVGSNSGTILNSKTQGGTITATSANIGTSAHTVYLGGLVGSQTAGSISGSSSSEALSYVYKGSSTGTSVADVGGLVGYNTSTAANSISGSSATGAVSASYDVAATGNKYVTGYIGGLVGQNGNNTATSITASYATGAVSSALSGGTEYIGGLVGLNYIAGTGGILNTNGSSYATGNITYMGTTSVNIGGLIGFSQGGLVQGVDATHLTYATGTVTYTGATNSANMGGLIGINVGSAVSYVSASGAVTYSGNNTGIIGGLIGYLTSGSVSYVTATGNVSNTYNSSAAGIISYTGGLVGLGGNISNATTSVGIVTMTNSVTSNPVHTDYIGGLVGQLAGGSISNSLSSEAVNYIYAGSSSGTSVAMVGGLVGYNISTTASSISGSSASGAVSASYDPAATGAKIVASYIGGLVGQNGNNTATSATNVFATGNVTSALTGSFVYVGGLVGLNYGSANNGILNTNGASYATGNVAFTGSSGGGYIGGLVGINNGNSAIQGVDSTHLTYASGTVSYSGSGNSIIGGLAGRNLGAISYAGATGAVNFTYNGSTNTTTAGGLVGQMDAGSVANSSATLGAVTMTSANASGTHIAYMGGLVGYLISGSITNSSAAKTTSYVYAGSNAGTNTAMVGGLVGYNISTTASSISGSSATGAVSASYDVAATGNKYVQGNIGGLVGENGNASATAITASYATGTVTSALLTGTQNIGGLVGYNHATSTSGILNTNGASYATGAVSYTGTSAASIGGLVGANDSNSLIQGVDATHLTNATGAISYTGTGAVNIGGLVGTMTNGTVSYASATGAVSTTYNGSSSVNTKIGGLVGFMTNGAISNSSALGGTVTLTNSVTGAGGHSAYVGGLIGHMGDGTITGTTSSDAVSYLYKGSSSNTSLAYVGGLIGYATSYSANAITGATSASGAVSASYDAAATGNKLVSGYVGGLMGQLSSYGTTVVNNVSASGAVSSTLISTGQYVGGLIGYDGNNTGTGVVTNATISGDVSYTGSDDAYIGGAIGYMESSASASQIHSTNNVTGTATGTTSKALYIGGLVGRLVGTMSNSDSSVGLIKGVVQTSSSGANSIAIGGAVGNSNYGTLTNTTSSNAVSYLYSGSSTAVQNAYVGGLMGLNTSTATSSISGSSASGAVSTAYSGATGNQYVSGYIGGLVGQNGNNTATAITNNFATGAVSSGLTYNSGYQYVGGLVGYNYTTAATGILNTNGASYAAGNVNYTGTSGAYLGGLLGYNTGLVQGVDATHLTYATGTVTYTGTSLTASMGGLIGQNTGTVSYVSASGAVTYSGNNIGYVGGLVGNNSSNVSYATAIGNVSITTNGPYTSYIGGLVGYSSAGSLSNNTTSTGLVTMTNTTSGASVHTAYVGGLVGQLAAGSVSNSSSSEVVSYVYKGSSSGTSVADIGGVVGYNTSTTANSISGSSATGAVSASYDAAATGSKKVTGYIGGLVGQNGNATATSVTNSFAAGAVSSAMAGGTNQFVGGLIGYNNATSTSGILNTNGASYATGAVSYMGTSSSSIGGLVGYNDNNALIQGVDVTHLTYASGTVTYNGSAAANLGGLVGNMNSGTVSYGSATGSVSNTYTGSAAATSNVGGLVGLMTAGAISYSSTLIGGVPGTVTSVTAVTGTAVHTSYVGGLIGQLVAGTISNSSAAEAVSYVYKGSSSGISVADIGGLVGYTTSTTSNSIAGSNATGAVNASYDAAATGNKYVTGNIGGLLGSTGSVSSFTLTNAFATGAVSSSMSGGANEYIGGLIGFHNGTGGIQNTNGISYATGNVSYTGTDNASIGGLIGRISISAQVQGVDATHLTYASGNVSYSGGNAVNAGGLIGSLAGTLNYTAASGNVSNTYTGNGTLVSTVGGLVGTISGGTITNSLAKTGSVMLTSGVTGSAIHTAYAGGLIGQMNGGTISNSYSTENVSFIYQGTSNGTLTASVGGLIGYLSGTVTNSSASGNVSADYASGYTGTTNGNIGGLVGQVNNSVNASLTGTFAAGNVNDGLGGNSQVVGGLVGLSPTTTTISDSYAMGMVNYTGNYAPARTGGLVGSNAGGSTIQRSYATGYTTTSAGTAGGLTGTNAGTITDAYWDTQTTGRTAATGSGTAAGTGLNTTDLQAALQTNFSAATWSIVAGISYPYLNWQITSGTPQVVSGIVSSDQLSATALAGIKVSGLIDGAALNSSLTNGSVYTGANGYYYYFLAPSTINTVAGSNILLTLPGATKANTLVHDTGNVGNANLYAGTLNLIGNTGEAYSSKAAQLTAALGGNSGSDYLFTLPSGVITPSSDTSLRFSGNGTNTIDIQPTLSDIGTLVLATDGTMTQSAALNASNLLLLGAGTITLANSGNVVSTLAGSGTGTYSLNDGATALSVGTVLEVNGLTAGTFNLSDTGSVSQTQKITATNASFYGLGGNYSLSVTGGNSVNTIAADLGSGNFSYKSGLTTTDIGSVNGINGVTANAFSISVNGANTLTQSQAINATTLNLTSTNGIFDLSNAGNNVGTLASSASAAPTTINFNNGGNNLSIGTIGTSVGVTATNFYLADTGTVSQTQAINATNVTLSGSGGIFNLNGASNNIAKLAGNVGNGSGTINLNNGANALQIATVNAKSGISAAGILNLTTTGTVTQTSAINAVNVSLSGAGGIYTLTNTGNKINILAVNTGTVNYDNGVNNLSIGTVNGINGVTATNFYLNDTGTVSQTAAGKITASTVSLTGTSAIYTLNMATGGNAIGTLAASTGTGTGTINLDNGGTTLSVGTVNSIVGVTTGNLYLTDTGNVTQSQAVNATNFLALGTGGSFSLSSVSNNIGTLAGNTDTILVANGTHNLSIGSVNGVDGVVATSQLRVSTSGTMSQTQALTTNSLRLGSGNGTYQLNNVNNNAAKLAADVTTLSYNNGANNLSIATLSSTVGVTATNFYLTDTGTVSQSSTGKITATNLSLSGTGGVFNLATATGGNAIATLASDLGTGTINLNDGSTALIIGSVNSIDGVTATNLYLTDSGTITQTTIGKITATNGAFSGGSYDFSVASSGNAIANISADAAVLKLQNGTTNLSIGSVNGLNGITVTSSLYLRDSATISQTALGKITSPLAALIGTSGTYNLASATGGNAIGTLAASTGTVNLDNGTTNLSIGTAYSTNGITTTNFYLADTGAVTQTAVGKITSTNLALSGSGGSFSLNTATGGNAVTTLAANVTSGTVVLDDGTTNLSIGTVNGINGTNSTNFYLADTGTVSQTAAGKITATNVSLTGAGATYTLNTTTGGNAVSNLAANTGTGTGTINLDNSGTALAIGSVNGITGITTGNLYLTDTGNVAQSNAINANTVLLSGAGGTYTLSNNGNTVGTLAANTGTVNFNNGSTNLAIGTVNGINGVTVTNLYLADTSTVSQTATGKITAANVSLKGAAATYTINTVANAIDNLAISGGGTIVLDNGANNLNITTVNGTAGVVSAGLLSLTTTGNVTQSQAMNANKLLLLGSGGNYALTNSSNTISLLAGNTGTINLNNGATNLGIGMVSGTNGVTAANFYLTDTGTVTQTQAISATNMSLSGAGGIYTLTNSANTIGTLAGNTGTINLNDGANALSVGTVNAISGVTATNLYLTDTGAVSQLQKIVVTNLAVVGAGGTYDFENGGSNNNIGTVAANTDTLRLNNNTNNLVIGSVNGINGANLTTRLKIKDTGTVTQTQAVTTPSLALTGGTGIFTLTNTGNVISSLGAAATTVELNDGSTALDIGTASGTVGVTATNMYLTDIGAVTQSQVIAAANLALSGTGGIYTLTNSGNTINTLAANTGTINLNDGSNNLAVGTVNGVTGVTTSGATTLKTSGDIALNQAIAASGSGTAITLVGGTFHNNAGVSALSATNGRFLVWSGNPASDNRGGLSYDFKQYNATYGVTSVAQATGNGFLYTTAPNLTASLTGTIAKTYDGNTAAILTNANYSFTGTIDGDTLMATGGLTGTYDTKDVGTGKDVSVTGITVGASNGVAIVYGYQVNSTAHNTVGTITPKGLIVTADDKSKVYGSIDPALSYSYSGLASGDSSASFTGVLSRAAGENVASYTIGQNTLAATGNYTIATFNNGTFTITPAALTITADDKSKIYGAALPTLTASYSGLVNGDTAVNISGLVLNTMASASSNVGDYAIAASGASNSNYTINYVDGNLHITPASLTITADDKSKVYGAVLPTLTASYSGLVNGDTAASISGVSLATTATASSNVADYAINVSGGTNGNYTITRVDGTLHVTPASLTITADDKSKVYGAALPALTASYSGLVNGDTAASISGVNLATTATASSNVADYAINVSGGVNGNYTITRVNGTLHVIPATLTITADDKTRIYGDADPLFTASYNGLVNGDTAGDITGLSLNTTAVQGSNVGDYAIAASGANNGNYTISYVDGNLHIDKRDLTVGLTGSVDKVYNGNTAAALDSTNYILGNVYHSDDVGISNNSGTYDDKNAGTSKVVTVAGLMLSGVSVGNYSLNGVSTVSGTIGTITPKGLTVTADDKTKVYGVADPSLTYSYTGLVGGDVAANFTGSLSRIGGENVNTYAISQNTLAATGNYMIQSFNNGSLTITPAALTITADEKSKVYGATMPGLTASYGGLTNGDTATVISGLVLSTGATASSNVGTYAVTGSGAVASNYTISYVDGNLHVTPATLTITANDKTRVYGDANPILTASYSGLVNGDTAANITGMSLSTIAVQGSTIGDYTIAATGASNGNYTISYADGNLHIDRRTLTVGGSFTAANKNYDMTRTATVLVNNLTLANLYGGDTISIDPIALFDTADSGKHKSVGLDNASSLIGMNAYNYSLSLAGAPIAYANIDSTSIVPVVPTIPDITQEVDRMIPTLTSMSKISQSSQSGDDTVAIKTKVNMLCEQTLSQGSDQAITITCQASN